MVNTSEYTITQEGDEYHFEDSDTEDASETDQLSKTVDSKDMNLAEDMKQHFYLAKLQNLQEQLRSVDECVHVDYKKGVEDSTAEKERRTLENMCWHDMQIEQAEREYLNEVSHGEDEFLRKRKELRESMIADILERKKQLEAERSNMDLMNEIMPSRNVCTRKLRRRHAGEISVVPEKRRLGITPVEKITYLVSEPELEQDLALIRVISGKPARKAAAALGTRSSLLEVERHYVPYNPASAYIARGCLYYDQKCFIRHQTVFVDNMKGVSRIAGTISYVDTATVVVQKADQTKIRVALKQLQSGRIVIRHRTIQSS